MLLIAALVAACAGLGVACDPERHAKPGVEGPGLDPPRDLASDAAVVSDDGGDFGNSNVTPASSDAGAGGLNGSAGSERVGDEASLCPGDAGTAQDARDAGTSIDCDEDAGFVR